MLLLSVPLLLVTASPVAAQGPTREAAPLPDLIVDASCGYTINVTFPVNDEYALIFTDSDDQVTRLIITGRLVVTLTNALTGASYTANISGPSHIDFVRGTNTQEVGVDEGELHETPRDPGLALTNEGLLTDETVPFVPRHGKTEASLQRAVVGRDVVAPMPVALLHAERIERVVPGEAWSAIASAVAEHVEDGGSELGRNVDLPTELTDVRDAAGANSGIAEIYLL